MKRSLNEKELSSELYARDRLRRRDHTQGNLRKGFGTDKSFKTKKIPIRDELHSNYLRAIKSEEQETLSNFRKETLLSEPLQLQIPRSLNLHKSIGTSVVTLKLVSYDILSKSQVCSKVKFVKVWFKFLCVFSSS